MHPYSVCLAHAKTSVSNSVAQRTLLPPPPLPAGGRPRPPPLLPPVAAPRLLPSSRRRHPLPPLLPPPPASVRGSLRPRIHAPPRAGELRATASGRWSMAPAPAESRRPSSLPFPHRADPPPSSSGARCRRLAPPPPSHALLQLLCAPPHGFACEERGNPFLAHLSPRDGKCLLICLIRWRRILSCTV